MAELMPRNIEIPEEFERALKQRAAAQKKSLDAVVIETLARGLGVQLQKPMKNRDLSDIAGSWVIDPETEVAFEEQRQIDPDAWK